MDFLKFKGQSVGPQRIEYTWRDVALYALGVGAHKKDLIYTYEKYIKALPSYGVIPYWNAIHNYPQRSVPYPASIMVKEAIERETGRAVDGLHMEHELIMHRPIDSIKGTFVFQDTITDIFDRGEGKGIVVKTSVPVYDEAGNLICENISSTVFFAGGGFGGEKPPANPVKIPEADPDYMVHDNISEIQNLLYRLSGDTNHIHVNPEVAQAAGFPEPIMQGLCSFGFACRMAIEAVIPGEPEKMSRMAAQMRNVCYPGDRICFLGWKLGEGKVVFRLINEDSGKPILDKGIFEYM